MPRIDPEKLLHTLAPLLEQTTGAVKSHREVDKIYGLMSKFSKKLVSKCTYINILQATQPDVLDLFLDRGGWDMLLTWTEDANTKRNYELLKEITSFLLKAPASIQRLKENELPKIIKSLSKDCENEDVRELSKKVVLKWLAIAKQQDNNSAAVISTSNVEGLGTGVDTTTAMRVDDCSLVVSSTGQSSDTVVKSISDSVETPSNNPIDSTISDLNELNVSEMIEFNPDDFSKVVDQHLLGDAGLDNSDSVDSNRVMSSNSSINNASAINNEIITNEQPKLVIKSTAGQQAVVQGFDSGTSANQQHSETPYYMIVKDGKQFLVKLKLATPQDLNTLNVKTISPTVTSEASKVKQPDAPAKRRTKKEQVSKVDAIAKEDSKAKKTYSKKFPIEPLKGKEKDLVDKSKIEKASKIKEEPKKHKAGSKSSLNAAKEEAFDKRLREKIDQEKLKVKVRNKQAAREKQQQAKDQETLKKLNLIKEIDAVPPSPRKIPKIPRKQTSFADAIGIPGSGSSSSSSSPDKLKKPSKTDEESRDSKLSDKKEKDSPKDVKKEKDKSVHVKEENKDRRANVKVKSQRSSRADNLLKDLTETTTKSKSSKVENSKSAELPQKSAVGNSLISKPEKRPSLDGIEKPGDVKKQKLSDDSDKKKEPKPLSKEKKVSNVIVESSLFMDALTASSENVKSTKPRKLRRLSSSEKEPPVPAKSGGRAQAGKESKSDVPEPQPVEKPVFNFYRETLDDDNSDTQVADKDDKNDSMEVDDVENDNGSQAFNLTEDELKLKSVLVMHRAKDKPRKSVRWREDDELQEVFTFELDEEERVNVTRNKDFSTLMEDERAEEKQFLTRNLKRRILGVIDDCEEKMPWRKPYPLILNNEELVINSHEKDIQEERERLNLGVFLPPGSLLPETPEEPDLESPNPNADEPRIIPVEDVLNVTKVFDKRNESWPQPVATAVGPASPDQNPFGASLSNIRNIGAEPPGNPNFNVPSEFNNPWNIGAQTQPPPMNLPSRFPAVNMAVPPAMGFPHGAVTNPFGFPVPNNVPGFPPSMGYSGPPMGVQGGISREPPSAGRYRDNTRDFGDKDLRAYRDKDDRPRDNHDRGHRMRNDYRSRDFDRRRSPSPDRRRRDERDRYDRDYRDQDYRSRPRGGRRDIPCRYYRKGYCSNGSRCEFLHGEPRGNDRDRVRSEGRHHSPLYDEQPRKNLLNSTNANHYDNYKSPENLDTPSSPPRTDDGISMSSGIETTKIIPVE